MDTGIPTRTIAGYKIQETLHFRYDASQTCQPSMPVTSRMKIPHPQTNMVHLKMEAPWKK